jgi:hypothetical protein
LSTVFLSLSLLQFYSFLLMDPNSLRKRFGFGMVCVAAVGAAAAAALTGGNKHGYGKGDGFAGLGIVRQLTSGYERSDKREY